MADHDKTTPAPATARNEPAAKSRRAEIDAFIQRTRTLAPPAEAGKRGRLIFALDATMSRQPTWDTACKLQGEMFREAGSVGGLDVQLVYFRGLNECRASRWVSDGAGLGDLMGRIHCMGGHTQIRKVLQHARAEADRAKVAALVYVGDAMEEGIDDLAAAAGELGLRGVAAFMFHEGHDPIAEQAFREIARLTRGAYCRFDLSAAHELGELLRAAAVYAAGGVKALTAQRSEGARKLLAQMR
jgi:hypothetical protein